MILIGDILVSEDIVEKRFVCKLDACKGACCWEGDLGAPVAEEERPILEAVYPQIEAEISEEARAVIARSGKAVYYDELEGYGTPLLDNGACVYLCAEDKGIAKCSFEKAWEEGKIDFKKPVSCHLYPIRVEENPLVGFRALNYDEWDICSAACALGEELKVPVYRFVREALIRRFGEAFYAELDAVAAYMENPGEQ